MTLAVSLSLPSGADLLGGRLSVHSTQLNELLYAHAVHRASPHPWRLSLGVAVVAFEGEFGSFAALRAEMTPWPHKLVRPHPFFGSDVEPEVGYLSASASASHICAISKPVMGILFPKTAVEVSEYT